MSGQHRWTPEEARAASAKATTGKCPERERLRAAGAKGGRATARRLGKAGMRALAIRGGMASAAKRAGIKIACIPTGRTDSAESLSCAGNEPSGGQCR